MEYPHLAKTDSAILQLIQKEEQRQQQGLELIASENYTSPAVLEAMASVLQNKYSEGYPGKRYYAGNEVIDEVEELAIQSAQKLFGANFVNVQALSGAPANLAVYLALAKPGDTILGLKLDHGGHLSHGHPVNFTGQLYNFVQYGLNPQTGYLDMAEVRSLAQKHQPKIIVAGFSAYSRNLDWVEFRSIADEVGAYAFADVAHIAGLIAGKAIPSPLAAGFDVVTTTTHKTLRGPRGALIFSRTAELAKKINRAVFPGLQGGPHEHVIAAIAVALREALQPAFQIYAQQIIKNAQKLATELQKRHFQIISGGTDNHLMVLNLQNRRKPEGGGPWDGRDFTQALEAGGISVSMSTIPDDPNPPMRPSGVRLGVAAVTTRGMGEAEMVTLANLIELVCAGDDPKQTKKDVEKLAAKFPVPGV